jgi:hypothetical protein
VEEIGLACGKVVKRNVEIFARSSESSESPRIEKKDLYVVNIDRKSFKEEIFGPGSSGAPIFVKTSDTTVQAAGLIVAGKGDEKKIIVYVTPL